MYTYKITFNGRTAGAIGITYNITDTFQGDTLDDAKLSIYDKYEHIRIKHVMSFYRVAYSNGDFLETGFNGSLADAERYYLGQTFNFGDVEGPDKLVEVVKVEQI